MSVDWSTVTRFEVPEGQVAEIKANGVTVWSDTHARYVSLGDSIAAGHAIDLYWEDNYGERSQYGERGNAFTEIVPGCYTDLIRGSLGDFYGGGSSVKIASFARSGDTVADLMAKLDHEGVRAAIADALFVTVCIGANDVLQPALMDVDQYIESGDLSSIEAVIEANMARLADDSDPNSYAALFAKLRGINPDAKYAFMTIYNPYKYLWLEDGHNGFFKPLLNTIPSMDILSWDIDGMIKDGILNTSVIRLLFDRVNGLGDWTEQRVVRLNEILRSKIAAAGSNFVLADAKAAFDAVPDRTVPAPHHYNDLVNVELTRGFVVTELWWSELWNGSNASAFWSDLVKDEISIGLDGVSIDFEDIAKKLVERIIEAVIVPDIDPHPESYGHQVLASVFGAAIG
jgi:lysophospholipase L1-like esterase